MMYVLASQTGVNCRRLNNNMKDELFFDIIRVYCRNEIFETDWFEHIKRSLIKGIHLLSYTWLNKLLFVDGVVGCLYQDILSTQVQ